ncbi:MAG: dTMP kinase [Devosiaceae bacterium]
MAKSAKPAKQFKDGYFISFEGGEGSGKSTQSALLAETLRSEGYEVVETHEPGGSPGGKIVREVLLGGHAIDKGPLAEACLLTSARREHVDSVIKPALKAGKIVLCDRFADSTRVYQGYVGGLPDETINRLEAVATAGEKPRITFVLDVDKLVANGRRIARLAEKGDANDRFEREDQSFHDKVGEGFRKLCQNNPERCVLVDGNAKPNAIGVTIRDTLRLRDLI